MSIAERILNLCGWRVDRSQPLPPRYVLIGAPHTSNWDFPVGLLGMWALGIDVRWVGKHTLFRGLLGPIMRGLGGIPVDRRVKSNFIETMSARFASGELAALCLAPEGTRSLTHAWKTGFYYLALAAEVPVVLGYLDFADKAVGVGGILVPTGDIERDMIEVRAFYASKTARHPELYGEIRVRSLKE